MEGGEKSYRCGEGVWGRRNKCASEIVFIFGEDFPFNPGLFKLCYHRHREQILTLKKKAFSVREYVLYDLHVKLKHTFRESGINHMFKNVKE